MANYSIINKCRACKSKDLVKILSLGNQYLADFLINKKKPMKFPLELILCKACNLLQLKHTVSKDLLYTERYGYKSGINNTMQMELKMIVEQSIKRIKKKRMAVADIGANDGTLLSSYDKKIFRIGVEPIEKFANECQKHADTVVNDFFTFEAWQKKLGRKKADIITVISCFYDMEDPDKFIGDVRKILASDGLLVIQQNYLATMLKQNAFDNIVHEHLEYYSLTSLDNLLKRHGMEVFDVELSEVNGGSFRTYIGLRGRKGISKETAEFYKKEEKMKLTNPKTYENFAENVSGLKKELFNLIKKLKSKGKKVYIYGASTRGNTLLQYCGLDRKYIKAAVERNPEKWGKIFSSVGIPIISEEQGRRERPDYMLVLPWFFKNEFIKREKTFLKSGGHFIFPLPKVKIV